MKKSIYFAGAMLLAMTGCSNETSVPGVNEGVEKGLEPITLGLKMASASVEESRGTGTVGGTTDEANVWRYENLYVLMTTSDGPALENDNAEWGFTSVKGDFLKEQFDNSFFARPKEETRDGVKVWAIDYTCDPNEGGNVKYYPAHGKSDFFAYYVDDAAVNDANGNPEYVMENNEISVAYTIDGSQDLMLGKADVGVTGEEQGFSAKTARLNIIPSIKMQHMLTRLTFTLHNGNTNTANITVKNICVESKNKGKMFVAYQNEPANKMVWEDAVERLYLKQAMKDTDPGYFVPSLSAGKCPLIDFEPVTLDGINDVNVGEALFICPGETQYTMHINLEHSIMVGGVAQVEEVEVDLNLAIGGNAFEAGKSYHVVATIYGLEEIKIDTNLEKWDEYGEDIEVGGDN